MDLSKLDVVAGANAGTWVDIISPRNNQPTGIRIKVRGADSDAVRDAVEKAQRARLDDLRAKVPDDEARRRTRDRDTGVMVLATLDWQGVERDGAAWPFSADAAREAYERYPVLREQVAEAIADRGLFLTP
jgi:hypothetical protein